LQRTRRSFIALISVASSLPHCLTRDVTEGELLPHE
jgi:hypothetical protein